jgi:hypothetical protein
MASDEQIQSLYKLIQKVIDLDGDFVECGVYKGGLSAFFLFNIISNNLNKKLYIYDTFTGMAEPNKGYDSDGAVSEYSKFKKDINAFGDEYVDWCYASIQHVTYVLSQVTEKYLDFSKIIKGKVEDTLLEYKNLPKQISIARLDTDWYESTRKELEILYPLVVPGGIIIIDDYYYWTGSRKATDEYLSNLDPNTYYNEKCSDTFIIYKK